MGRGRNDARVIWIDEGRGESRNASEGHDADAVLRPWICTPLVEVVVISVDCIVGREEPKERDTSEVDGGMRLDRFSALLGSNADRGDNTGILRGVPDRGTTRVHIHICTPHRVIRKTQKSFRMSQDVTRVRWS